MGNSNENNENVNEVVAPKQNDMKLYNKLLEVWNLTDEQKEKIEQLGKETKIKLKNIIDYDELQCELGTEGYI